MFSLGSFSSIMPFLILAITYFAGITTYSITFAQNGLNNKKQTNKTIKLECSDKTDDSQLAKFEVSLNSNLDLHNVNLTRAAHSKPKKSFVKPPNVPFCFQNKYNRTLYLRPPPYFQLVS